MKSLRIPLLSIALLPLLAGGCENAPPVSQPPVVEDSHADHVIPAEESMHGAVLATERVQLANSELTPGNINLTFTIKDPSGKELTDQDLLIQHERLVHLLLVRDDMTQFRHLHPTFKNGAWIVEADLPEQGAYQMYVDIAPKQGAAEVLRIPFVVGGPTEFPAPPVPQMGVKNGSYFAQLFADPSPIGISNRWTFEVTKDGSPVSNIEPYLGAYGHVVELKHGEPDGFFHVHPSKQGPPTDGRVTFDGTFPTAGRYTLYAQFKIDGTVYTFPITVDAGMPAMDHSMH